MSARKTTMVKKRDGSLEAFQIEKLRRCLGSLMESCQYDVRVADALAKAVAYHLTEECGEGSVSSRYIYQCVQAVLKRTGLTDVADELSAYSRFRSVCRRRLRVRRARVAERNLARWQKKAVVDTLETQYQVQRPVARILAGEIESRVFSLGYNEVSQGLVDELIRNELHSWGLQDDGSEWTSRAPSTN